MPVVEFFFFQAEDGIRDLYVTGVQTCALPIFEVKLDPVDNQRLARLCGSLDENLRQIESALDVTIARRGAKFTVRGEQAERAAQALEQFYDRASSELTLDDVQLGLTELAKNV